MDEPAKRAAALSPASRARFIFLLRSWGLRPRLYAFVRFAEFNARCCLVSGLYLARLRKVVFIRAESS